MANLKIKILTFFMVLFVFTNNVYAEVVNKIEVMGNKRISLETIAIFGDIILGKNYESSDINLLIKKLYDTTFFSNISVELKNNKLILIVEENPIINNVVFNGEKAKKYKESLKEILILREKSSFIDSNIKNDINQIKEFYRELGFYFVKIEAEVEKLQKNRVNIVYTIDKGEKAKISKIFFLGDKKIRDKKLRDIITSQEARFWKFISRNVYLSKQRIELDKRLLQNYYKNKGFYEVNVTTSNVEYSEGEGFVLTYSINAGKRYRFKKISASVSEKLDKSAFNSLESSFDNLIGEYYSQKELKQVLDEIDKLSEQKELQFINHNVLETLDESGVEVTINIFEGDKFIIERINIVGNTVTNDSVIRSELIVDEGDPFSTLLVNKSVNKIKGRNIFGKVVAQTLPGSKNDLKILELSVEEKATGEIMAGAGIGTEGTSFTFAVAENNWLGKGINLKSSLNASPNKISGALAITDPNYKFTGNQVNGSIAVSATDQKENSGYESSRTGVSLGTAFEQYENIFLSPKIMASYEDIEVTSDSSKSIKKMEGTFTNIDLLYGISLDKRNQAFQPSKGYIVGFQQSLPVVQDSSSIMNMFNVSKYHEFSDDVIGSLKFSLKSMHGIDDDVRITNRLFIPTRKLRGFNTDKVGPKDGTDYIGGNYVSTASAEAQLPNLLPESYRTDFSVFMDAGNVWEVDYSDTIDDTNKIRSAVGISANVYTTIGPLSFTLAQHVTKATNDETETFNFRLGTSF